MFKKFRLFGVATFSALAIAFYSKHPTINYATNKPALWKTFEKKSDTVIGYKSTKNDLENARIQSPGPKREIASIKSSDQDVTHPAHLEEQFPDIKNSQYLYRENRVLIGEIQKKDFQDENTELEMINKPNLNWKEILGNDLLKFQNEETKVLIKEEIPVIKIQFGKGQYLEQVIVTYLLKNGNISSYRALVDSETGAILDTWDKTINENQQDRASLSIPTENNSGIIAK